MERPPFPDGDDAEQQNTLDAPKLLPIQTCEASQSTSSSASIEDEAPKTSIQNGRFLLNRPSSLSTKRKFFIGLIIVCLRHRCQLGW